MLLVPFAKKGGMVTTTLMKQSDTGEQKVKEFNNICQWYANSLLLTTIPYSLRFFNGPPQVQLRMAFTI